MAQSLPAHEVKYTNKGLKHIPPPQTAATQILRFEGRFKSDFRELQSEFTEQQYNVDFIKTHMDPLDGDFCEAPEVLTGLPTGRTFPSLRLEALLKNDEQNKTMKYLRYFEKDIQHVQKAGLPMPDIGLIYYRLKIKGLPAECYHMSWGTATYADGSQYKGFMKNGVPQGEGTLHQFEEPATIREPVATYEGQWVSTHPDPDDLSKARTVREGHGMYTIRDHQIDKTKDHLVEQLRYDGDWKDDQRHGHGQQEIVDENLQRQMGYYLYDGDWMNDKRHGRGEMTIKSSDGDFVFEGDFVEGSRHGHGIMRRKPEGSTETLMAYNGEWKDDVIVANAALPAWSQIEENIYFGELSPEGDRQGIGTLYRSEALEDPDFRRCFECTTLNAAEREYKPGGKKDTEKHRYKLYEGKWERNLPNGEGVQFFLVDEEEVKKRTGKKHAKPELTTYMGQFLNGKRHGRGVWEGLDGKGKRWKFRPIPGTAHNWANDQMHGIAIVEDDANVHENVVYTMGKCQMPFTQEGPPMTGFSEGSRMAGIASKVKKMELSGARGDKSSVEEKMKVTTISLRSGVQRAKNSIENPDVEQATQAQALGVMVRQPTDLTMPEEDVLVTGCTGGNKLMNGLYFKMSGTFGVPIFKHSLAKKDGSGFVHKFLYRDTKRELWLISDSPANDTVPEMRRVKNCAMVEDRQEFPGRITQPWFVWHEDTNQMRVYGDKDPVLKLQKGLIFKADMNPIDKLEVQSVVGFEVTGLLNGRRSKIPHLLMRQPSLYFGRPVYEAESGGQFLYWHAADAPAGTGVADAEMSGPGQIAFHEEETDSLWQVSDGRIRDGWWIISDEVGLRPEDKRCQACVKDSSMTPDQIMKTRCGW
jgi:hypothetical protein